MDAAVAALELEMTFTMSVPLPTTRTFLTCDYGENVLILHPYSFLAK